MSRPVIRTRTLAALVLLAGLLAPGCVVLRDDAGVDLPPDAAAGIEAGRTTRAELLTRFGPPTGRFSTNLLAAVTRSAPPIEAPLTPGSIDDDVLTWQAVHVRAHVAFFPLLFTWVRSDVASRTLTVFLDDSGVVRYVAWREDEP